MKGELSSFILELPASLERVMTTDNQCRAKRFDLQAHGVAILHRGETKVMGAGGDDITRF
jgi:hypothetical protein